VVKILQSGQKEISAMRLHYVLTCVLLLTTFAAAKEPKHYQSGKLLKMESVKCGMDQKNGESIAGELVGTDSTHMKSRDLLCQQYMLQADDLVYTIRPKDDKHPVLLPIGASAQFRLEKDKMMLRVEDMDDKERPYIVVAIVPKEVAQSSISGNPREVK
jgi:hypothetical protein